VSDDTGNDTGQESAMTDEVMLEGLRVALDRRRAALGRQLADCREAAELSQPELGRVIGETRTSVSKVENGWRGRDRSWWERVDGLCGAGGGLVAAWEELDRAIQEYRGRVAVLRRQRAKARRDAAAAASAPSRMRASIGPRLSPESDRLAEGLSRIMRRIAKVLPRREAIQLVGLVTAASGLSGLDGDEVERLAGAVAAPKRVDRRVLGTLGRVLGDYRRLEDALGPSEVLPSVLALHGMVRGLRAQCPAALRGPLLTLDSQIASCIGGYLMDVGDLHQAGAYFAHAREVAHEARNPACGAYAAGKSTYAAYLAGDGCRAVDLSAAARSLAARAGDPLVMAHSESMAAAAYAVEGDVQACLRACDRAQAALPPGAGAGPAGSPAYYVHPGSLASKRCAYLLRLNEPRSALDAATFALDRYDPQYVGGYARTQIRSSAALLANAEVDEACRLLGEAADRVVRCPSERLAGELRAVRADMAPYAQTRAVRDVDARLAACGLVPPRSL